MKKILFIFIFFAHNLFGQEGLLLVQPSTKTWAVNLATFPDCRTLRNASLYQGDCIESGVGNFNGTSNYLYAEYYFSAFSQNATLKPFWNPTITSMTVVNAWAWNAGIGYGSSSNTTGYGNLGYTFSSIGTLFGLNNAIAGVQVSANSSTGLYSDFGVDNTTSGITLLRSNLSSVGVQDFVNDNTAGTTYTTAPTASGFVIIGRNGSAASNHFLYVNGISQTLTIVGAASSAAVPITYNIFVGSVDFNGTSTQNTPYVYGSFTIGTSTVNEANLYHAQQYLSW